MAARKPKPTPEAPAVEAVSEALDHAQEASVDLEAAVPAAIVDAGRAQALSMTLLDSAAHLRRLSTLSLAAIATGLEKIVDGDAEAGGQVLAATEKSLDAAVARFAQLIEMSRG